MLDYGIIVFWSIAYVLIAYQAIRYYNEKGLYMPRLTGSLYFAWEINACLKAGFFYGHILWTALDLIIFVFNMDNLRRKRDAVLYFLMSCIFFLILYWVFRIPEGMLVSSFVIEFISVLEYAVFCKKISPRGKIWIGLFRMMGDAAAWLYNMRYSWVVGVLGAIILLLNIYFLACCMEENARKRRGGKK